jgi:hypothetical protein
MKNECVCEVIETCTIHNYGDGTQSKLPGFNLLWNGDSGRVLEKGMKLYAEKPSLKRLSTMEVHLLNQVKGFLKVLAQKPINKRMALSFYMNDYAAQLEELVASIESVSVPDETSKTNDPK